jgi:uncharacterized membrane protein
MKAVIEFLKTCLVGGLFGLLPLLLFFLLFSELMNVIVALATPIADLFPAETFEKLSDPLFVAIPLLLGAAFIFGLTLRSQTLVRFGQLLERATLMHVPLYKAVKRLSQGLVGTEGEGVFKSGLLETHDGETELVYIIEEHADGKLTVLVPLAPAGFTGSIKVVSPERMIRLDASLGDASKVVAHWGVGMSEIMGRNGR